MHLGRPSSEAAAASRLLSGSYLLMLEKVHRPPTLSEVRLIFILLPEVSGLTVRPHHFLKEKLPCEEKHFHPTLMAGLWYSSENGRRSRFSRARALPAERWPLISQQTRIARWTARWRTSATGSASWSIENMSPPACPGRNILETIKLLALRPVPIEQDCIPLPEQRAASAGWLFSGEPPVLPESPACDILSRHPDRWLTFCTTAGRSRHPTRTGISELLPDAQHKRDRR